mmetsp:Transcript_31092/g.79835  ORF Transcript_31092/g.79835 Transcript_31092/m.79835 type:complete len:244 (-) Transcript_31092:477-1208(-)
MLSLQGPSRESPPQAPPARCRPNSAKGVEPRAPADAARSRHGQPPWPLRWPPQPQPPASAAGSLHGAGRVGQREEEKVADGLPLARDRLEHLLRQDAAQHSRDGGHARQRTGRHKLHETLPGHGGLQGHAVLGGQLLAQRADGLLATGGNGRAVLALKLRRDGEVVVHLVAAAAQAGPAGAQRGLHAAEVEQLRGGGGAVPLGGGRVAVLAEVRKEVAHRPQHAGGVKRHAMLLGPAVPALLD